MTEQTFLRVIRELIALGFIDIDYDNQDGFIPGKGRTPTKYTISDRWILYGTGMFERKEKPRLNPKSVGFKPGNKHGRNC